MLAPRKRDCRRAPLFIQIIGMSAPLLEDVSKRTHVSAWIVDILPDKTSQPLDVFASDARHRCHSRNVRRPSPYPVIFGCNVYKRDARYLLELPKTNSSSE